MKLIVSISGTTVIACDSLVLFPWASLMVAATSPAIDDKNLDVCYPTQHSVPLLLAVIVTEIREVLYSIEVLSVQAIHAVGRREMCGRLVSLGEN